VCKRRPKSAKAVPIDLLHSVEPGLVDEVRRQRWRNWRKQNRVAIEAYNRHIERDGTFGDEYRRF
jgi:antitoxin CcdA